MKAKNIFITLTVIAAVLTGGAFPAAAGGTTKTPAKKAKAPPCKPPKGKQNKPKKVVIRPALHSAQAVAVSLSNAVTHEVVILGDTGALPGTGGSLAVTVGATNLDSISIGGATSTASAVGGVANSSAEVQNFSLVFVSLGVTNVIAFTSASAEANAEATATGVVLTASSQVQGLTVNGVSVAVTGAANQVITIPGGSIVLNAQMSSVSTNGQQGEITVAAIFFMTDVFTGAIAQAEAGIRAGSALPPDVSACGKVTGGGFITGTPGGGHGSFGVSGGLRRGEFWGHLNYVDHDTGMHVSSTAVIGFTVVDAVTRKIDYNVTIDGAAGTASCIVADNGEPGRRDLFDITLSTGYHAGGDLGGLRPGGGNIQLHKCPPGWAKTR